MVQRKGGEYHNDAYESSPDGPKTERTSDNNPFYVCLASDVYALLSCNPAGIISAIAAKSASLAAKVVTKLVRSQICGRVALPGVKGAVKAGRPFLKNALPNLDQLSKAGQAFDRNGLTKAGRALQKHGNRKGSLFPKPKQKASEINTQGQEVLDNILKDPSSTISQGYRKNHGIVTEVRLSNRQEVRYSERGDFIGFLD